MANTKSNVWDLSEGFDDGLNTIFKPRQLADDAFRRGQEIIDRAYKTDENQDTRGARFAKSEKERLFDEQAANFYQDNPNYFSDQQAKAEEKRRIEEEKNRIALDEAKAAFNEKSRFRSVEQQTRDALANAQVQDTFFNYDTGKQETYLRNPVTDIERLDAAYNSAGTYEVRAKLKAELNGLYVNTSKQAVAAGDYVTAVQALVKSGQWASGTSIEQEGDKYKVTYPSGVVNRLSSDAVQQMFFSQDGREKLAIVAANAQVQEDRQDAAMEHEKEMLEAKTKASKDAADVANSQVKEQYKARADEEIRIKNAAANAAIKVNNSKYADGTPAAATGGTPANPFVPPKNTVNDEINKIIAGDKTLEGMVTAWSKSLSKPPTAQEAIEKTKQIKESYLKDIAKDSYNKRLNEEFAKWYSDVKIQFKYGNNLNKAREAFNAMIEKSKQGGKQ